MQLWRSARLGLGQQEIFGTLKAEAGHSTPLKIDSGHNADRYSVPPFGPSVYGPAGEWWCCGVLVWCYW
jgi:hypothetical protein